ncbi:hypothetical protein SNE40_014390 [Patella caerulea]|uniref:Uncharacterized protein n=1 Tax=Patella caerulea TaxID=87958 RepID=A0AAN8PT00_PATCE
MAPKILGKPPDIQYTENTISRVSFRDPARFKCLNFKLNTTRYGYTPTQVIAKGIVPDLTPPAYRIPQ